MRLLTGCGRLTVVLRPVVYKKRQRVGIDFLWTDESNSGRVNYIYSLVSALATLPEGEMPHLVVFHLPGSPIERLKRTDYPFMEFQALQEGYIPRFTITRKVVNRFCRLALRRNLLQLLIPIPSGMVDCVIPCEHAEVFRNVPRRIHWIVDFNCYHLPQLFPGDSLEANRQYIQKIVDYGEEIMLSSHDAFSDFKRFFPESANQVHVLQFAVGLPEVCDVPIDEILKRYSITKPYFITPNTFWPHKNHQVLVKAMREYVDDGGEASLVLTGKQVTHHGDSYFREVKELVRLLDLEDRVLFLGMVERSDQVALLKNARAIIQPSRFEGWSTVVEEAKALGVPLLVSDIAIHREQVGNADCYFPVDNPSALSKSMLKELGANGFTPQSYTRRSAEFARSLVQVLES